MVKGKLSYIATYSCHLIGIFIVSNQEHGDQSDSMMSLHLLQDALSTRLAQHHHLQTHPLLLRHSLNLHIPLPQPQ